MSYLCTRCMRYTADSQIHQCVHGEVETLRTALTASELREKGLREALEFYADANNWENAYSAFQERRRANLIPGDFDPSNPCAAGGRARKALALPTPALTAEWEVMGKVCEAAKAIRTACCNTGNYGPLKIQPGKCTCVMCDLDRASSELQRVRGEKT